jgi:anti-sigma-K factor RskA
MTWTCDQTEARLSDYLEGLLQAPERAEFEVHVRGCAECAPLVESVRSLMSEMQSTGPLEVPSNLVYSILDQTLGPRERVTFWQGVQNFLRGLATPRFAYGAGSVMATLFILLSASGLSWRKPKLADLDPSTVARNVNRQYHLQKAHVVKYVSDLRVVYEIQSRLRQDENQLQAVPQETVPKSQQDNKPDDHTRTQPKQQNRADELARQMELLAAECPLFERSYR